MRPKTTAIYEPNHLRKLEADGKLVVANRFCWLALAPADAEDGVVFSWYAFNAALVAPGKSAFAPENNRFAKGVFTTFCWLVEKPSGK